jgi:DNA-binding response OmpR family regulator
MISCLLVTADPVARDLIKVGLEQTQAFDVDVAEDTWAVEMARSKIYRVVIADAELAAADGLEILRQIREVRGDAELLLIARNRNQTRHLMRDKQQLALYGFVHIPVDPLEFFKMTARLLERIGALPAPV